MQLSNAFDSKPLNMPTPERRVSRLPFDAVDPFGYALNADSSPFDLASPSLHSRQSQQFNPPSPSSRSFRSLHIGSNAHASASAASLGSHSAHARSPQPPAAGLWQQPGASTSQQQLSPPPAWQPQKPRSQSFSEAMGVGRSQNRASYLSNGPSGRSGLGLPMAKGRRSKLSGEVTADVSLPALACSQEGKGACAPAVELTVSSPPDRLDP